MKTDGKRFKPSAMVVSVAKMLAEWDKYTWQQYPNATQERKQRMYVDRAEQVADLVTRWGNG